MSPILCIFGFLTQCLITVSAKEHIPTTTIRPTDSDNTILNSSAAQDQEQLEELANTMFDEYWQITLRDNPEIATIIGDQRYDDRLTCYSLKCYEKRKVMMSEFLERANQMLSVAEEGSETQINLQLFITNVEFKLDHLMSGSYLFPLSKLYTPQMSIFHLLKYMKLTSAQQYWNLIARYKAIEKQIHEQIDLMREGIRTNFTLSERSLFSGRESLNFPNVQESPFFKPFLNITRVVPANQLEAIEESAVDAISNHLIPALENLADFMENEYRIHTRPDIGVDSLPNGREFYRHELFYHLTDTNVTAEDIHNMGLLEVERISGEMDKVIQSLGLNMTRQEFSNQLRNDSTQLFSSEEEALETYRQTLATKIAPRLVMLFKTIPGKQLTVEKIPKDMATGPQAFYMIPSADNSTPGTFFLDTSTLKNIPKYDVITLAMHEGVPGHHFQHAYIMEQTDIPEFRKFDVNSNSFTEGWALYAEYLGFELGLFADPYMRYGHFSYEIFRACRMVVDTGMHVLGWSRQQAIDYLLENTAKTLNDIEREVDRYITWPGQACSYKYGEMKLKKLRQEAEEALGEDFDIKEFHDIILRVSGPLELVEREIQKYIQSTISTFGK